MTTTGIGIKRSSRTAQTRSELIVAVMSVIARETIGVALHVTPAVEAIERIPSRHELNPLLNE